MNRQVNGSISETWIDHVNFAWHLNISHGTCLDVLNPTSKVHRVQWERNLSKDLICDVEQCIVFSFLSLKNVVFKYSQFCLCFHSDGVLEWTGNALPSFRGCHTGRRIGSSSSGEATRFRVSRKTYDVNGTTVSELVVSEEIDEDWLCHCIRHWSHSPADQPPAEEESVVNKRGLGAILLSGKRMTNNKWNNGVNRRVMGSEFLGKRAIMGSEFLGKRALGSEFLGKRAIMGSEFLGKRSGRPNAIAKI